jgi:predicted regulator of Ras-like GTPase activity (Roadblock/LC7/MglB family)
MSDRSPDVRIATPDPYQAVHGELAALRHQVTGVRGCVIAGVDGLLVLHDTVSGAEPHDVSALAAAAHGVSRTCGAVLDHGTFREVTIRNVGGYLAIYAIDDLNLLAAIGDSGLNIARLHLEVRSIIGRLATLLEAGAVRQAGPFG